MKKCEHNNVIRGKDVPRVYGSYRTKVCIDCKQFMLMDHFNNPMSEWKEASKYSAATTETEEH